MTGIRSLQITSSGNHNVSRISINHMSKATCLPLYKQENITEASAKLCATNP